MIDHQIFISLSLIISYPLVQSCASMLADAPPCVTCSRTLANSDLGAGQCDVNRTCVSCITTEVVYGRGSDSCLEATVTCPVEIDNARVRLLKNDGKFTDVQYDETLKSLKCNGAGWEYKTDSGSIVSNIKKAICFGNVPGFQESPIALELGSATYSSDYDPRRFDVNYGTNIVEEVEIHHDYSGFHIAFQPDAKAYFTASHLDARYRLVQYHAHWNNIPGMQGSEHTLDGVGYPAEFHFVHVRDDFETLAEAVGGDGVAVIGIFAELSNDDNPNLTPLIEAIVDFNIMGSVEEGDPIFEHDPAEIFPEDRNYMSYSGSLTTGEYSKCVSWNILTTPITISQNQLDVLATLFNGNNRDIYAIDSETTVYKSIKLGNRQPLTPKEDDDEDEESTIDSNQNETNETESLNEETTTEESNFDPIDRLDELKLSEEEEAFLELISHKYSDRRELLRSRLLSLT